MRKNLVSFLLRLAIVTFLLTGGQLTRSLGHDLPNYFPYHELGADCLGVKLPAANAIPVIPPVNPPAKQPVRQPFGQPVKLQMINPSSLLALGLAYSDVARQAFNQAGLPQQAQQQLSSFTAWLNRLDVDALHSLNRDKAWRQDLAVAGQPKLFAALPDDAPAPAPARAPATALVSAPPPAAASLSARSLPPAFSATVANLSDSGERVELVERLEAKRNYLEDYLPYDLCISDWRFGQYSYRGLSRIAHLQQPLAEVTNAAQIDVHPRPSQQAAQPTAEALAHGEILSGALGRLSDFQCRLCSEFCGFDSAYELGALSAKAYQGLAHHAATHANELAAAMTPARRQPFYTEPIYVVYELDGKLFLISAEQAQEWRTLRATLPPPTVKEVKVAQSIRQTVLSVASQQLTSIGNQLLNVASTLESFSGTKVAGRNEQDVR